MQASGGWGSLGPFWKEPVVLHRAWLSVLWVLHDYCLPGGDLPVPVENTDHASAREASGRAARTGTAVVGATSGFVSGAEGKGLITPHWLASSRTRTIRHRTARATIVARSGICTTRAPSGTLCAAMPRSDWRGRRVISRAATVALSGAVAEPLGKAEISAAKAGAAASPGS